MLYGRDDCQWTTQQRAELGEQAIAIPYVDCNANANEETVRTLKQHPTWKINGTLYEGFFKLDDLMRIVKSTPS